MKKANMLLIILSLIVLLPLLSFNSCGSYTPSTMPWTGIAPENLTQQQWQDILIVTQEYHEHLETYSLFLVANADTDVTGGSDPWESTLKTGITGIKNLVEKQAQMLMNMSMMMEGKGQTGEEQGIIYDMYAKDDWLYVDMISNTTGSYWVKVKRNSELEEKLNLNIAEQQIKLLNSPSSIEYIEMEQVNEIDCYVLSISPNKNELVNWLDEQNIGFQNIDWQKAVNDTSSFQDFSFKCYLAKDSYLITRMSVNMIIELTPEQAGETSSDFDTMLLSLSVDIVLYDYNIEYIITLPAGAESATEVSSNVFLD